MKHPCDCLGRQHSPVIWNGMEHPDCNHLQLLFELQGDCEKCDTNRKQRLSMKTRRRQVGIFHQNYKWLWRSAWKQSKNMEVFGDFTQRQPAPTHLLQWVRKYSFSPHCAHDITQETSIDIDSGGASWNYSEAKKSIPNNYKNTM